MNCPKYPSITEEYRRQIAELHRQSETFHNKHPCPKCGSEMVDDVWPYIDGTEYQHKCLSCGHSEKVKPCH